MIIRKYKHFNESPLSEEERKTLNDEVNKDYLKSNRRKRKAMKAVGLGGSALAGLVLGSTVGTSIGAKKALKDIDSGNWAGHKKLTELIDKHAKAVENYKATKNNWWGNFGPDSHALFESLPEKQKEIDRLADEINQHKFEHILKKGKKYGYPGAIIGAAGGAAAAYGGYKLYKKYKDKKKEKEGNVNND